MIPIFIGGGEPWTQQETYLALGILIMLLLILIGMIIYAFRI